ncbi:MAG: hypothetical protein KC609_12945 [Myxococcales bacterium]|nr:hypothetical protein [Myxococcales bacterium]
MNDKLRFRPLLLICSLVLLTSHCSDGSDGIRTGNDEIPCLVKCHRGDNLVLGSALSWDASCDAEKAKVKDAIAFILNNEESLVTQGKAITDLLTGNSTALVLACASIENSGQPIGTTDLATRASQARLTLHIPTGALVDGLASLVPPDETDALAAYLGGPLVHLATDLVYSLASGSCPNEEVALDNQYAIWRRSALAPQAKSCASNASADCGLESHEFSLLTCPDQP